MSFNDTTADMIATIKNGQRARIAEIDVRSNKLNKNILKVLQQEGYINGFEEYELRKGINNIKVSLRYFEGQPAIRHLKKISKAGLRNYSKIDSLKKSYNGLGVKILSTSKGVLADHEARKENVGGEVICEVF